MIDTEGLHPLRLAFLLGPDVEAGPVGAPVASSISRGPAPAAAASATLQLPDGLRWETHRGELDPILGWYSPSFGVKQPTTAIVGTGRSAARLRRLQSALVFHD